MKTVFISKLKPFLDIVSGQMDLYVPKKSGEHYTYSRYDSAAETEVEFNNIRACTTIKDFLFPVCELASVYPRLSEPEEIKPFAVFGLKDCDLRSIEIMDKVFMEEEFEDALYIKRREKMFIISSDCSEPAESCFCNLLDGKAFAQSGFDLNVSKTNDGFIIEVGSQKGEDFIEKNSQLFVDVPESLLAKREKSRAAVQKQLEQNNAEYQFDASIKENVESSWDSDAFDVEAEDCVECQGCTRVCPTCHCFYLYDTKQKDYFTKMKMWDSCMRMAYTAVAGGANPHKILGDRIKHRFMHKFVYFLDRYGMNMCVGCGRCIDGCIGGIDTRAILKKLSEKSKVAK